MTTKQNTKVDEFIKFHELLTSNAPKLYKPFYFTVEKGGKEPVPGVSWKKNRKTFEEAVALMQKGYNIGIAGTDNEGDYLCIMDVDDLGQVEAHEIKPTLQVTSRKRLGRHYYYFSYDKSAKQNIPTKDAGELRSVWQYVLAPGSYVTCSEVEVSAMPEEEKSRAGLYTVTDAITVADVTFEELPAVYKARFYEAIRQEEEARKREEERKNRVIPQILRYKSKLWDLTMYDVSGHFDTGYKKIAMPSEMHNTDSGTGKNCQFVNGLMICWRHYVTHNPLSYLAVLAGLGSCEQCGKPHGGGSFGIDFQDGETIFKLWVFAKQKGMIPEDDPIPHSALVYYALKKKLCFKKQIIGGRLPPIVYENVPKYALRAEGINFGRQ